MNWVSLIQRGAEPGVHPAGLFVQCTDEVASARRALAGAKCAKTVLFTVPKLVGKDDEKKKKKKRDAVKSARERASGQWVLRPDSQLKSCKH